MHVSIYARMHTYIFLFACVFIQCRMQLQIQWNVSVHACKCYKLFRTPEPCRSPTFISFYEERYDWSIFLGFSKHHYQGARVWALVGYSKHLRIVDETRVDHFDSVSYFRQDITWIFHGFQPTRHTCVCVQRQTRIELLVFDCLQIRNFVKLELWN